MVKLFYSNKITNSTGFINKVFSIVYNVDQCEITILHTPYGKPYLQGFNNFYFNIAHTENIIVCAVSDYGEIGVDIEKERNINEKVIKRFFSKEEQAYIQNGGVNKNIRYTEIITKKEAYSKMMGLGLKMEYPKFNVFEIPITIIYLENYIISICCEGLDQKSYIEIISMSDM